MWQTRQQAVAHPAVTERPYPSFGGVLCFAVTLSPPTPETNSEWLWFFFSFLFCFFLKKIFAENCQWSKTFKKTQPKTNKLKDVKMLSSHRHILYSHLNTSVCASSGGRYTSFITPFTCRTYFHTHTIYLHYTFIPAVSSVTSAYAASSILKASPSIHTFPSVLFRYQYIYVALHFLLGAKLHFAVSVLVLLNRSRCKSSCRWMCLRESSLSRICIRQ